MRPVYLKLTLTVLVMVIPLAEPLFASGEYTIEISTTQPRFKVGEPLLLDLAHRYQQPQMWRRTGEIAPSVRTDMIRLQIQRNGVQEPETKIMPARLLAEGTEGRRYTARLIVFYDDVHARIVFDEPGTYTIHLPEGSKVSNVLRIEVDPASALEQKGLTILSDLRDIRFLIAGAAEKSTKAARMSTLKKVVEQCGSTVLARWASARLGLERFAEFEKKHRSFDKFKELRKSGAVAEPLFTEASAYLEMARRLPGGFPIRQEVLGKLVLIAYIEDDYDKGLSLAEELITKYPERGYGKKAVGWRDDFRQLKKGKSAESK